MLRFVGRKRYCEGERGGGGRWRVIVQYFLEPVPLRQQQKNLPADYCRVVAAVDFHRSKIAMWRSCMFYMFLD